MELLQGLQCNVWSATIYVPELIDCLEKMEANIQSSRGKAEESDDWEVLEGAVGTVDGELFPTVAKHLTEVTGKELSSWTDGCRRTHPKI